MSEDRRERPITMVAQDMIRKTDIPMSTAIRRIEILIDEGLVEEKSQYSRRNVIITDKGKKVVEYLKKIDEVMEA
jgi:predicted transcriptional regulator